MKALFIPLKAEFFAAFADGSKTVEFRRYGPRWNERTCWPGRAVVLSRGYGRQHRLTGVVTWFRVSEHHAIDPGFVACYGANAGPVACVGISVTPNV
jgi:hypothetical protein